MGALFLVVFGVVINRWNVTLSGLVVPPQWSPGVLGRSIAAAYIPSWVEIAVSVGVLGYAFLAFTLGAEGLLVRGFMQSSLARARPTHTPSALREMAVALERTVLPAETAPMDISKSPNITATQLL